LHAGTSDSGDGVGAGHNIAFHVAGTAPKDGLPCLTPPARIHEISGKGRIHVTDWNMIDVTIEHNRGAGAGSGQARNYVAVFVGAHVIETEPPEVGGKQLPDIRLLE
jgi:hypothetical protein